MTQTVKVYTDGHLLLGEGTATAGSASITSFTVSSGGPNAVVGVRRNVVVAPTTGSNAGKSFKTRTVADGGTSLTLANAHPFAD